MHLNSRVESKKYKDVSSANPTADAEENMPPSPAATNNIALANEAMTGWLLDATKNAE